MPNGYCGHILDVDLTTGAVSVETPGDSFYRAHAGGRGLIAESLLRHVPPGADPLGPENLFIIATGVLTGAHIPGSGRHSVGAKSPLTGGYGDAEAGGFFGVELKRAGFDAVLVRGRAASPVFLAIRDGICEIRDASHLQGLETQETESRIREALGDRRFRIAQCGPAGERLVRYACVVHELRHFAGRCGLGAVMGSKNLRAVAVRGTGEVPVADPDTLKRLSRWMAEHHATLAAPLEQLGTMNIWEGMNASGGLPTRNFREGSFEGAAALSGQVMNERFLTGRGSCFACPVRCKPKVAVGPPWNVTDALGGPEYETVAAFGSNCGVASPEAVALANQRCNALGLDTISTGVAVAFAMECAEAGIISREEAGGLDLRFGNAEAMLALVDRIGRREGLGNLLAEGVMRAAASLGRGAEEFAMHVKGQEIPLHDPRLKPGLAIGYAVSPTGADHHHSLHDTMFTQETKALRDMRALGPFEPLPRAELGPRKARLHIGATLWRTFASCVGMCTFLPWDYPQIEEIIRAATGWNTTTLEMRRMTDRALTLARLFNLREGGTAANDTVPNRFFTPYPSGPLAGEALSEAALREALSAYYSMMGWDGAGIPTPATLCGLGIEWAAP